MTAADKVEKEGGNMLQQEDTVKEGFIAEYELSPEEDRRILRKIDFCLLPVMALSYLFQFMDKTALGATAIMGLPQDLHLTGSEYSWASGIYYFGYLVASYPVGVMMVRWRVGKTIGVSVLIWGAILMLTAACFNAGGLLTTRFFLGVAEAAIAPGLTIIISMWYKRSEQPLRHAAWFLGNTCAGVVGGLTYYGIGHIQTIAPWKASFLVLGAVTICWSIGILFLLPDTPSNAWFLKDADRDKAVVRVKENLTGIKNNKFKWEQCLEAICDPKTWFLFFIQLASNIPNGGVTTFSGIVIKGFGFSTFDTLLLSMIPYGIQLFLVLLATGGSTYFRNTRTWWMTWNFALALVGAALVRQLPSANKWGRFIGCCLSSSYAANFPLIMSLLSGNVGGFTKKTTANAMVFIAYCLGNIIGPQLFFEREAPTYESAFLSMMICLGFGLVITVVLRFYLIWVNKRRDSISGSTEVIDIVESSGIMANLMDMTDKNMPQFRYVY